MKTIQDIIKKQNTIDELLKLGDFSNKLSDKEDKWVLESLHHDGKCSVGIVHIDKLTFGPCKAHVHYDSKEYLICVSGAFVLNINGSDVRRLQEGDCASIDPGQLHYSRPLFDKTTIVYVCVPADKGMETLGKA